MLEILVRNVLVDLPEDIQIAMTNENPLFISDKLPVPYSLSFQLPRTPKNSAVFAHANRLATHQDGKAFKAAPCKIFFQSICILQGTITLDEYNKGFNATFKAVDFNDNLKAGFYKKDFGELIFSGDVQVSGFNNPASFQYHYKAWTDTLAYNTHPDYIAAPIYVKMWNHPFSFYREHSSGNASNSIRVRMITMMQDLYLSMFNVDNQSFFFKTDDDRTQATSLIFPLFRIGFLINCLVGNNLISSPFSTSEMRDVLVPSFFFKGLTRAISSILTSNPFGVNPAYVTFSDYMPEINANDFLRTILNIFCMTLATHKGGFVVKFNREIFQAGVKYDWSNKLIDELAISKVDGLFYEYGFQDEEYYVPSEAVPEVDTHEDMYNTPFNLPTVDDSYEGYFYIKDTEQYFLKSAYYQTYRENFEDKHELMLAYDFKGYKKPPRKEPTPDQETYDAKSDIKQMYLQPSPYWTSLSDDDTKRFWTVPMWIPEEGDGQDKSKRNVRSKSISLLLYSGVRKTVQGNKDYPFVSPYKNDNISLKWDGDDGLLNKYHLDFKNWIERTKTKITGTFLLSPVDLNKLAITDKIHVQGRNFFIEKMQYVIRKDKIDPVIVDLVEV